MVVETHAPAKVNLSLEVLGVRADGYHELRTVFQSIALHDTITARTVKGAFRFACDDPRCPVDETNLVWRAAERVWAAANRRGAMRGFTLTLIKRIPIEAGLGGGSSDAAATIRTLGRLLGVSRSAFHDIAKSLGADVPYFLEGGTALGLDRGDLLYPLLDAPPAWVLLVVPTFGVSTRDAYLWWDADGATRRRARRADDSGKRPRPSVSGRRIPSAPLTSRTLRSLPFPIGRNDLAGPVIAHHPVIARILRMLEGAGASLAAMSGSGSAVFGLFETRRAAVAAHSRLSAAARGRLGRVFLARTLDRAAYQQLAR